MAEIFGKRMTKREVRSVMRDVAQIAGARMMRYEEGRQGGVRVIDVHNCGLNFTVVPDRGMDISLASYRGTPIAWRSATRELNPRSYEPEDLGWLQGFYGGLMVTCGLTAAGLMGEDAGEKFGLHGRASYIHAEKVGIDEHWNGNDYDITIQGELIEAAVFGHYVALHRTIHTRLGERIINVTDVVENRGSKRAPLMLIYHCNFGWPLVTDGSKLLINSTDRPREDEDVEAGYGKLKRFDAPKAGIPERVFEHKPAKDRRGMCTAAIVNESLPEGGPMAAWVRWPHAGMPYMWQWKMMDAGTYVCGLEPTNCPLKPRWELRKSKELQFLKPGETRTFSLEFGVATTRKELSALKSEIRQTR